jgi:hypothetical protein
VGSCAPACPITQQNYIDFVYGAMTAAEVTTWPRCVLILQCMHDFLPCFSIRMADKLRFIYFILQQ